MDGIKYVFIKFLRCVCNKRSGRRGIAPIVFTNMLLILFMIVCRIVFVFGWYYIDIYKVSAIFVCNKRSGRRGIAVIDFTNILLVCFMIVCHIVLVFGWY